MTALTCMVFISANPALGAVAKNSDLVKLISQYRDTHMTVNDLAFFLATHNFDATPKDGYVQVKTDDTTYKVMADLSIIN